VDHAFLEPCLLAASAFGGLCCVCGLVVRFGFPLCLIALASGTARSTWGRRGRCSRLPTWSARCRLLGYHHGFRADLGVVFHLELGPGGGAICCGRVAAAVCVWGAPSSGLGLPLSIGPSRRQVRGGPLALAMPLLATWAWGRQPKRFRCCWGGETLL